MKNWMTCLLLATGTGALAALPTPVKLASTYGVSGGDGQLVVLGPEGSWDGNHGKECVYDGELSTFIDPTTAVDDDGNGWAGFETTVPVYPTRIRYAGRPGYESRAKGCLFQGANTADFSDAVTLHVANPPSGWVGSNFVDVSLPFDPQLRAFKYFRMWGPTKGSGSGGGMCGGNMAEVEFWGVDILPLDAAVPSKPAPVIMDALNGHLNARFTVPSGILGILLQRHGAGDDEGVWTDVAQWHWGASGTVISRDAAVQAEDCTYRLGYVNAAGTSQWHVVEVPWRNYARGTVIGTGAWGASTVTTKDKVWDGDIQTFYAGAEASGCWSGLDLGEGFTARLAAIRYVPRGPESYYVSRMVGRFQTADNPEFTDATDLYVMPSYPGSYCLTTVTLDDPPTVGRYVRYLGADGQYCDVGEVEFELTGTLMVKPSNFAVTWSDLTNQYAVLTWANDLSAPWQKARVQRATAAEGPYETLAELERGATSYVDETCSVGIPMFYRVAYAGLPNDAEVVGAPSATVFYRRCRRLDRDWSDLTHLAEGLTLIQVGTPWNGGPDDGSKCFDGSLTTFGDLDPVSGSAAATVCCGIDFGADCKAGIGFFRAIPRQNHSYALTNLSGTELWGSDDSSNWSTSRTQLGKVPTLSNYNWFEVAVTESGMYRYVYFNKTTGNSRAAFAEVEFYGWTLDDIAGAVLPPTDLQLAVGVGPVLQFTWKAGANAAYHRVERQVNNGAWTVVAAQATGESYVDRDVNYTTGRYTYRVTAVNGGVEAVSATTATKVLYQSGNGTGLHAVYRYPYTVNGDAAEAVVREGIDPAINFNWGSKTLVADLPEATDNVAVTWSGRLIVPFDGDYVFSTSVDDKMLLLIDGVPVMNVLNGLTYAPAVHLTAGEHPIRVDYYDVSGNACIGLYWSGAVDEAGIPSTQFIPEEVPALPDPWEGERTFGAVKFGWTRFTDAENFAIAGQGSDFYQANSAGHFVWRRQRGDFDCSFRFAVAGSQLNSKIMLVTRNANTPASPIFAGVLQPSLGATIKYRTPATNGIADLGSWKAGAKTSTSAWLRLVRKGNVMTYFYRTSDNADWTQVGSYTDEAGDFAATQLVGVQVLAGVQGNNAVEPSEIGISNFTLKHEMPTMLIVR